MNDVMQPRDNPHEQLLHINGYRVEYTLARTWEAYTPDRTILKVSQKCVDDCWTACYQHYQKKKIDINKDMFTFAFTAGINWGYVNYDDTNLDDGISEAIEKWKELHRE